MAFSLFVLACAIIFMGLTLSTFTLQLSLIRSEMPKTLDRIDRQIAAVQTIAASAENMGNRFSGDLNKDISTGISSGINKGITEGIVDIPVNTMKTVGKKISNTAIDTGTTTYDFWQGIKGKLMFWQKKPPTSEASKK